MFNPSKFKTPVTTSVVLCNSEHPVLSIISSDTAKRVPGSPGLFFVRTLSDEMIITYNSNNETIQVWECGYDAFKRHITDNTNPYADNVFAVNTEDKYIGNTIHRVLMEQF